jgi:glycosyltransferase involved in cell wall biosynthesis
MNVLSVAYPLFPVSADSAGGAEQILFLVERGLAAAGHRSVVVAARGSQVSGELVETPVADGEITEEVRRWAQAEHRRAIEVALHEHEIDLIHFHGLDFYEYLPEREIAQLATLHLPVEWYPTSIFELRDVTLNYVSRTQAADRAGPVVCNGVDLERYAGQFAKQNFLLMIGRICPEKGTDVALRVAHRLDLPMVVAGPVHPFEFHQKFFREQVEPLFDEKRLYVGPVGLREKPELLGRARCLLIPSSLAETSSLVAMEAISAGTAVVAFRSGALPEVVEDGVTGFLCDSEEEMALAIRRVGEISREQCREQARARFSSHRMVADYLQLYRGLVPGGASQ